MRELLGRYVAEFNANDEELYQNDIPNKDAEEWLAAHIPLFECPDRMIEKTYYFRWWTYRKHIKTTPEGYAVTEFLPKVPWSGAYNVINAPAGHHFYEGRWLRDADEIFSDYLRHFLSHSDDAHVYSTWLLDAARAYEAVGGDLSIGKRELDGMIAYYAEWEKTHGHPSGMFWSYDNYDAMEYSISGHRNGNQVKGVRPTLNSYMYADALAIAHFAARLGEDAIATEYTKKAERLRELINTHLLFDGFYKAKHGECDDEIDGILDVNGDTGSPMELIGYVPYMFGIPEGNEGAFFYLEDPDVFLATTGMATADRRHPDYLKEYDHECLWNGYVWPYATSQVLTGLIRTVNAGHPELKPLLIKHLSLYANSHRIEKDGKTLPWIDEVMHPDRYEWTARSILEKMGWQEWLGGKERGKDYNHSTFCDLLITGIVGVRTDTETLTLDPAIPPEWEYLCLAGLPYRGKRYTILYDKTGKRYGKGEGWQILPE